MKQASTLFLKIVIFLIGTAVLAVCVAFTVATINHAGGGLFLPVVLLMYVTAVPFFFALYQTLKLLSYIDKNKAFSELSVKALQKIKYCAIAISALYTAGMPLIIYIAEVDDSPGSAAFGAAIIIASIAVAAFAAVLQKLVQNGLDMKSENELTV